MRSCNTEESLTALCSQREISKANVKKSESAAVNAFVNRAKCFRFKQG